jgi:hypothetical protein
MANPYVHKFYWLYGYTQTEPTQETARKWPQDF